MNHARVASIGMLVISAVLSRTLFMVADISLVATLAIFSGPLDGGGQAARRPGLAFCPGRALSGSGPREEATERLRYVADHGNKLAIRAQAEERLKGL